MLQEGHFWGKLRYMNKEEYFAKLHQLGKFPKGFRFSTTSLNFFPIEKKSSEPYKMDLSLLLLDEPTSVFAGMFTRNQFPGAPVLIGRSMLEQAKAQGLVVNNRISNVSAPNGVDSARAVAHAVEQAANLEEGVVFPSSTGIIGWRIPEKEMVAAVPHLVEKLTEGNAADFAKAIMTTDSYPKMFSANVGEGKIVGVAKGAGMIEPNMATMLCFIMTDLKISREDLRRLLEECIETTFNSISIDSDQSTSDTVLAFSSAQYDLPSIQEFKDSLQQVLQNLASHVVRNGEGTGHVLKVQVNGFESDEMAQAAGKAIVNSPLVKTAVFGNDPNVGRFISSLGDFCGNQKIILDPATVSVTIGLEMVYKDGAFLLDEEKEERLYQYFKDSQLDSPSVGYPQHEKYVEISVTLPGKGSAQVLGSDLSYEYIKENAEYRS